ncbi:hypothetical protein BKA66DRAFT_437803 [Pyrenochaeta sp. MPI-SDFR-AT-0127]|nr:hypothetical protein BKA66DRAFT_437803 [Pyrenochaeta sp. MPI-SDFR-AT-0127]
MGTLTAFNLVSSIIQFVDVGSTILKTAREIEDSSFGMTKEDKSLEEITKDMRNLSLSLGLSISRPRNDDERALLRLAQECRNLSEQLLDLIQGMVPAYSGSKLLVLVAAAKRVKYKNERKELERKLANCRAQLHLHYSRLCSVQTQEQLIDLASSAQMQTTMLDSLDKGIEGLEGGIHVASLSEYAQRQIRNLFQITDTVRQRIAERQIRKCLAFSDMHERFEIVDQAHFATYRWLLENNAGDESFSLPEARERFLGWLSSGSGIFHIAGKLGSGKSTLMKFICAHPRTDTELRVWAGQCKLIVVNFFFWKPGSRLQKSLAGLYRSLLHDVCESCPELMPLVFPHVWNELLASDAPQFSDHTFSDEDVVQAFQSLIQQRNILRTHRFCFFIDALDEYEETHQHGYRDMVNVLYSWTENSLGAVKICVSSREHNVFQNTLSAQKRIRLQDLTWNDMIGYTRNKLEDLEDIEVRNRLVQEIVARSDGIFLWVVLVVKALREALEDGRDPATFEAELEMLPTELEALFQYLLSSIPKTQIRKAYQLFAMVIHYEPYSTKLSLLAPLFLNAFEENPEFALEGSSVIRSPESEDVEELRSWHTGQAAKAERLVQGYCKGLVEARESNGNIDAHNRYIIEAPAGARCILFVHRTVVEFLQRLDIQKVMEANLVGFDVVETISQLHLAEFQSMHRLLIGQGCWVDIYRNIIAMRFRQKKDRAPYRYLMRLESVIGERFESNLQERNRLVDISNIDLDREFAMWAFAAKPDKPSGPHLLIPLTTPISASAWLGDVMYVHWRLQREPDMSSHIQDSTVILHCLRYHLFHNLHQEDAEAVRACFEILLRNGLPDKARYIWPRLVKQYASDMRSGPNTIVDARVIGQLIELLLRKAGQHKLHSTYLMAKKLISTAERTDVDLQLLIWSEVEREHSLDTHLSYDWEAPTMRMLADRAGQPVWLADLVEFWDFENKAEILALINKAEREWADDTVKQAQDCADLTYHDTSLRKRGPTKDTKVETYTPNDHSSLVNNLEETKMPDTDSEAIAPAGTPANLPAGVFFATIEQFKLTGGYRWLQRFFLSYTFFSLIGLLAAIFITQYWSTSNESTLSQPLISQ